jgi:hypothetical protein
MIASTIASLLASRILRVITRRPSHHCDAIGDAEHFVEAMGDEDHAHAPGLEQLQGAEDASDVLFGEAGGGLVEHEQAHLRGGDGARDGDDGFLRLRQARNQTRRIDCRLEGS